jgi:predicted MPP superfamily phosphohydrolase
MSRFWLIAAGYHVALAAVVVLILARTRARLAGGTRSGLAIADAVFFATATALLAVVATLLGTHPLSGFGLLRLVSQALFGETIVLAAGLAVLHGRHGARRRAAALAAAALLLVGVYWDAYHREPHALQISRHDVDLARGPAAPRALRIVHLTDLQTDDVGAYEDRVLREALAQQPDLVVFTGDFIQPRLAPTRERATADLRRLLRARHMPAPLGVYAVRGDVDADWPDVLADTGVVPLAGESVRVPLGDGRMLSLVGLTIRMSRGQEDAALLQLMSQVPPGDLRIVIGHNPNFVQTLAAHHVRTDLALAGHTHGGQVVLPLLGPPMTKMNLPARYASGLGDYEGIPLHVSRGIGMERGAAPQIRFLCPPEICVLNVRYGGTRADASRAASAR